MISLAAGIIIAISGLLPSYFLTAANIVFFGGVYGTLISFLGEAIGAWIAFLLYRKGFQKPLREKLGKYPSLQKLIDAKPRDAVKLIILFRIIPFIPSGVVTLAAAIGKIKTPTFVAASSFGKIPALLLEAFAMYGLLQAGKATVYLFGLLALLFAAGLIWKMLRKNE